MIGDDQWPTSGTPWFEPGAVRAKVIRPARTGADSRARGVPIMDMKLEVGPDPDRRSYSSFAVFSDPDGNRWVLQELTARLPGR
jgi:hypothetical protein